MLSLFKTDKMTFQKGNQLACAAKGKPKPKTEQWNNIVGWLIGDGGHTFKELIADLANGVKIKPEQKEFLNHYKDLLEFHQPKLSRKEVTGKDGEEFKMQIELINFFDKNKK